MRFDRCPVLPFVDDDGQVREALVLARRDDRVCLKVTRDVGMTHLLWRPDKRLVKNPPTHAAIEAGSSGPAAAPPPRS